MLEQLLARAGDAFADLTGYAATRVPLSRASGPDEVTLDLPGYCQLDSYCCGVVAGVMVLKHFKPRAGFSAFYARCDPHPVWGTPTARLMRALRAGGVRATERHDLTFARLCAAVDAGRPVIVLLHKPGAECSHWVTVYGYGRRPSRVFLASNGFPFLGRNAYPLRAFRRLWAFPGNGLICSAEPTKRRTKRVAAKK